MSTITYRPPVIVILGHVDHGKTTLLDYIRKTNHATKEIGGITQSIGAYEVDVPIKGYATSKITFIDTPGHEAFSQLRARGAHVADIALLIIDAVDSMMPQTIEAIAHIQSAKIPMIVVINKVDLPGARIEKVKNDLVQHNVMIEGLGGDIPVAAISAQKGTGIEDLLETILIIAEEKKFTFSESNPVQGTIIESRKDRQGHGASVILSDGCLRIGDILYAGSEQVKVKSLISSEGTHLKKVYPSTPFLLFGFNQIPKVGIMITTTIPKKELVNPDTIIETPYRDNNEYVKTLLNQKKENKKLRLILKTTTQGSLDAILNTVGKNETISVILATIGDITKSDIFLAKSTNAIIIGFSVRLEKNIVQLAEQEKVVIKTYDLIYKLLEELTEVSTLLNEKEKKLKQLKGEAKILAQFIIDKERVSGVKIIKGKLNINDTLEIYRNNNLIGKTKIASLKKRAHSVDEVKKNDEAGIIFYPQLDFLIGDMIKSYSI